MIFLYALKVFSRLTLILICSISSNVLAQPDLSECNAIPVNALTRSVRYQCYAVVSQFQQNQILTEIKNSQTHFSSIFTYDEDLFKTGAWMFLVAVTMGLGFGFLARMFRVSVGGGFLRR